MLPSVALAPLCCQGAQPYARRAAPETAEQQGTALGLWREGLELPYNAKLECSAEEVIMLPF